MRQNPLGRSELTVSAVGLGCKPRRAARPGRHGRRDRRRTRRRHHVLRHRGRPRRRRRERATDRRASGSRAYTRCALEAPLERLRTDRIDLLYYLDAAQLREAIATGDPRLAALENENSLLERAAEQELLPLCREHGIGFVPYFPLARGLLTGKFHRGEAPPEGSRSPEQFAANAAAAAWELGSDDLTTLGRL